MKQYFEFASRTAILLVTLVATLAIVLVGFPNLPINDEILDVKPSYSFAEVTTAMESYGEDGRRAYAIASMTLDIVLPLCYVTFFAGLLYRFRASESTFWLAYIPVVAGFIDLFENIQITTMLVQYPDIGQSQVMWSSLTTSVKSILGLIYFLAAVGLVLIATARKLWTKSRSV